MDNLYNQINSIPPIIVDDLSAIIGGKIKKAGIFARTFSRIKTFESVEKKVAVKHYNEKKKLQDLFGIRITLYFKDDIDICKEIIKDIFIIDNVSEDKEKISEFKPQRMNFVCKLPKEIKKKLDNELFSDYIDDTFEIQLRSVFSEGWHEIEHDLRYKCQEDWINETEISRALNGIYATLVTCDWSIIKLFDEHAYVKYKAEMWESMIKNKFRIRFIDSTITIKSAISKDFMKKIFKLERNDIVLQLTKFSIPLKMDNFIYIANELYIKDDSIITPEVIRKILVNSEPKIALLI